MPRSRVPVTRERALLAAMKIADEQGLEGLTMRRLASALGVEAMSLYHHLRNKEEILDGMVELVFAEMDLPATDLHWKEAVRARCASVREVLTRHPWAISIMQSRTSPGPATLGHLDAFIGCLRAGGFSVELTAHAISAIDSYVYGFVLQEVNLPFDDTDAGQMEELVDAILPTLSPEEYPHFHELTMEVVLKPGYSYAKEFDFGVALVLDGLEALRG